MTNLTTDTAKKVRAGASAAPRIEFQDQGPVSPSQPVPMIESLRDGRSILGEEFRYLRSKVQSLGQKRKLRCLALVSALPGEGKSTVTLGLAIALAREPGKRVLLIEADLRRPAILQRIGLPPFPGLGEWLNGAVEHVPVRRVEPGGFFLLSAGQTSLDRPEDLGSARMDALLRAAREQFDFVILDATPVLPVADVILLQDLVDGLLFVVRSRVTPRAAIHDALSRIRPDKIVGMVLNDHREYRGSYMSEAYRGYRMRASSPPASGGAAGAAGGEGTSGEGTPD